MKQLLVFLFLLCSVSVFAQDVIVKKDGSTIVCRVVELTSSEIVYKKWSDLNGSNYVMDKSLASTINYESGKKVNLSEVTNLYQPHNQNDGMQRYNDQSLLALDATAHSYSPKKIKNLKTIAWIAGPVLVAGGLGLINAAHNKEDFYDQGLTLGIVFVSCGVGLTTTLLLVAKHKEKEYRKLQSTAIFQYDLKFTNGSSLSAGIDMISDHTINSKTLGLGLRYNF